MFLNYNRERHDRQINMQDVEPSSKMLILTLYIASRLIFSLNKWCSWLILTPLNNDLLYWSFVNVTLPKVNIISMYLLPNRTTKAQMKHNVTNCWWYNTCFLRHHPHYSQYSLDYYPVLMFFRSKNRMFLLVYESMHFRFPFI